MAGLSAAVPLWIHQLAQLPEKARDRQRQRWADAAVEAVAFRGDTLQFGGKRGEAADVFNHLARGIAAAAFAPGGITFAGEHWCTDHAACRAAEAATPATVPPAPSRRRPTVDVHLPVVADADR
ncbi:hypothetical protein ABZY58_26120 [Micromonospora tulbaghiae]|uniref:hypothetical protein n=1 Tax=Micromonospora tulbaghiae TaxID=479978 RepID=UPI0033A710E9